MATSGAFGMATDTSESAFGHLAQAFIDGQPDDSAQLHKLLANPASSYYKRFEEFRKRLEPISSTMPPGLADNLTLDAIADPLRVSRNESGHPTGQTIDEDTAFTHRQGAARYLVRMTELTEHLKPLPF